MFLGAGPRLWGAGEGVQVQLRGGKQIGVERFGAIMEFLLRAQPTELAFEHPSRSSRGSCDRNPGAG